MTEETNLPDEELEPIAQEVAEAIPAIRKFTGLSTEDKLKVFKKLADKQIGEEETAIIKSVPGFPDMLVEPMSDAAIEMVMKLIRKMFLGDEPTG